MSHSLKFELVQFFMNKTLLQIKNQQFYSNLAEILAILPTHGLIILTKFDGDWNKIVDSLSLVFFWASVIFFESVFISSFQHSF